MVGTYKTVFGLLDNPFSPLQLIDPAYTPRLQSDLASRPLPLSRLSALRGKMFCPTAGPFATYMNNFKAFAQENGFSADPPMVGYGSHIFSIFGYEGTGKTTMVQDIISWLKLCKPAIGDWEIFDGYPPTAANRDKKIAELSELRNIIMNGRDKDRAAYLCIVVDNLPDGAFPEAIKLFEALSENWTVFMFLLSNDRGLFRSLSGDIRGRRIHSFRMRSLTADSAYEFIAYRIGAFRDPALAAPWLEKYPLFPFDAEDIQRGFESGDVIDLAGDKGMEDTVSLRQYGMLLGTILAKALRASPDGFNVAELAEDKVGSQLLHLSSAYRRLVNNG